MVVCNKIRKRFKSLRGKNNNVFLSELEEAAKSNARNTNIGVEKGNSSAGSCFILCGGCVGIFTHLLCFWLLA